MANLISTALPLKYARFTPAPVSQARPAREGIFDSFSPTEVNAELDQMQALRRMALTRPGAPEFPRERLEAASRLGNWSLPENLKWDGQRWQGQSGSETVSLEMGADGQLIMERLLPSNQQVSRTTLYADGQQREVIDLYETQADYVARNGNLRQRTITDIRDEKNRTSTSVQWEKGQWPRDAQRPTELSGRPPVLGRMTREVTRDGQTRSYEVERTASGRHELRAQDERGSLEASERWDSDGLHATFEVSADGHSYLEQTLAGERTRAFDGNRREEVLQGDNWKGERQHGEARLVEEATRRTREAVKVREATDDATRPILDLSAASIPSRKQFGETYNQDTKELDRAVDRAQSATKDVASLGARDALPLRDEDVARLGEIYTDKLSAALRDNAENGGPLQPLAKLYQARSILSDRTNPRYNPEKVKEVEARIQALYQDAPNNKEVKSALESVRLDAQFEVFGRNLPELAKSQAAYVQSPEFEKRLLELPAEQATEVARRELAKLNVVDPKLASEAAEGLLNHAADAANANLAPDQRKIGPTQIASWLTGATKLGLNQLGKGAGLVKVLGPIGGLLGALVSGPEAVHDFEDQDLVGGIAKSVGTLASVTAFGAGLLALSPAAGPGAPVVAAVAGLIAVGATVGDKLFGENEEETRLRKQGELLKSLDL